MHKLLLTTTAVLFFSFSNAQEPPGPGKPPSQPSLEDRLKHTSELLKKEINSSGEQQKKLEEIFKEFFKAEDKIRKENPPPPPPPPDPKLKAAMDKLVKDRDEKLKKLMSEEQFRKWKEAEKKMGPPRPGGPPPAKAPATR